MAKSVKPLGHEFFPNMGTQYLIGLTNVGVQVVDCTMAVNTVQTNAQIVASPPNTNAAGVPCGPVVHSFGAAPKAVIPMLNGAYMPTAAYFAAGFGFITADNSAVYIRATVFTSNDGGHAVKLIIIR
jgi:hypothetical protein